MTAVQRSTRTLLAGAALIIGAAASVGACSSSPATDHAPAGRSPSVAPSSGLGALPTYLPSSALRNDSALIGTAASPAVTSEGDEVRTSIDGSLVSVVVDGPVVPGEGLPVQQEATTCTWTVTLTAGSRPVAVSADQFNTLDHLGQVYRVAPVPGQPAIPASVAPGRSVTFELRAVMPTGEGLMRWAPDRRHIVGSWDFTVEND